MKNQLAQKIKELIRQRDNGNDVQSEIDTLFGKFNSLDSVIYNDSKQESKLSHANSIAYSN